jgi:thymidylate synthase (FAD)
MTDIKYYDDVEVELVDHMGSDVSIARAAQVSLKGENDPDPAKIKGLINYLMREHHGSPFEHNDITFYVKAPIFVFREWHRHRAGFSYNEMSGRYTELLPEFYLPAPSRPLVNVGTSARPEMGPAVAEVVSDVQGILQTNYEANWNDYQELLKLGIAKEVARLALPVAVMSQMYVSANLRAWLSFISLRTHDKDAVHVSRPQHEIELAARKVEAALTELFPIAMAAFNENGRVAP